MKYLYNTFFLFIIMLIVVLSGCGSSTAQAVQSVEIRPRLSGFINRIGFDDGARVRAGELRSDRPAAVPGRG